MHGWIKLHRSIADNDLWLAEPFTYAQSWVDLLIHANHKPASLFIRGIEVRLSVGDIGWSELTMAKRWSWSRGKVRRYLGMLENRGMIVQQKTHLTTVISICNYSSYQDGNGKAEQPTVQQTEQQTVQQTDNRRTTDGTQSKNVKKEKNDKKETTTPKTAFSDDDMRCAEFMIDSILKVQPDYKKPNMDKWANHVRLMRERDNRTHREICEVWKWARADSFWHSNIMSPDKLRQQYDKLKAKMRANPNGQHQRPPANGIDFSSTSWIEGIEQSAFERLGGESDQRTNAPIDGDFSGVDNLTQEPERLRRG